MRKKIRGIYGLRCPLTGAVRYVGRSGDIGRRYNEHCELMAREQGGGWSKRTWLLDLKRRGLRPELVVLQEIANGKMQEAEAHFIATYNLLGEADLNIQRTEKCFSFRVRKK